MKFIVADSIIRKYPDVKIGVIIAASMGNKGKNEKISELLKNAQNSIRKKIALENISEHPAIAKWRKVYSEFGSKPSDYRCSAEALVRSVLKGREIPEINKIVDLYNCVSLNNIVPAGGEDLDSIVGNVTLKFADGDEMFIPLNSAASENPYKGEVVYCDDDKNVLCRRWNWRESDKTKITEGTKNAILVIEGFDNKVEEALSELSESVKKFCFAETKSFMIDKNTSEVEW